MTIKILDIIKTPNAILHSFGLKVFEEITPYLEKNIKIELSFSGLKNVNSAFCNASVGKVYFDFSSVAHNLILTDVYNPLWQEKIDDAILLASKPEKIKTQNEAISELFC